MKCLDKILVGYKGDKELWACLKCGHTFTGEICHPCKLDNEILAKEQELHIQKLCDLSLAKLY